MSTDAAACPDHVQAAHDLANAAGLDGYMDPRTNLFVMTQGYLERRGTCCQNDCRHCPYQSSADQP